MKLFFDVKLVAENDGAETVLFSSRQETLPGDQSVAATAFVPRALPVTPAALPPAVPSAPAIVQTSTEAIDPHANIWPRLDLGIKDPRRKHGLWRCYLVDVLTAQGKSVPTICKMIGLSLTCVSSMRNRSTSYSHYPSVKELKAKIESALKAVGVDPAGVLAAVECTVSEEMARMYKAECFLAQGMALDKVAARSGLTLAAVRRRASGKLGANEPTRAQLEAFISSHGVGEEVTRELEQSVKAAARKAAITVGG